MRINRNKDDRISLRFDIEDDDILTVTLAHEGYEFSVLRQKIDTTNTTPHNLEMVQKYYSTIFPVVIKILTDTAIEIIRFLRDYSRKSATIDITNGKVDRQNLGQKLTIDQQYVDYVLDVFERIYNLESFQKYLKTKPRPAQRNIDRVIKLNGIDFEDIASLQDFDYFTKVSIGTGISQKDQDTINQYSLLHKDTQVVKMEIDDVIGCYNFIFFVDNDKLESFNNAITAIQQKQMVKRLTK